MKTLKITTILMAAGLFCSSQTFAQQQTIGAKVGYQSTSLYGTRLTDTRDGMSLGLQYLYHYNDHFVMGTDLIYSRAGGFYSYPGVLNEQNQREVYEVDLHQLRFNPKAYIFFREQDAKFRPLMGFGFGATFNMKEHRVNGPNDYEKNIRPVSLDAVMDVGFHYRVKKDVFFTCNLEYTSGLTMMQKQRPVLPETLRNHILGLNVGLCRTF